VLSNELSKEHLKSYAQLLKTPIEVLVFGRILLFYSPRKLLSPLEKNEVIAQQYISASGTSEESPHSGFPLIENMHGTFMFNVKDLSLIENLSELREMGILNHRLDLRFDNSINQIDSLESFNGPRPLIKGFYQINKTDILFSKLKNKKTLRSDLGFLGVIVDVEREKGLAILVKKKDFNKNSDTKLKIITPEGKEKKLERYILKNSLGEIVDQAVEGDLLICTYINGVTVKSQVYLE
jgi:putative protease